MDDPRRSRGRAVWMLTASVIVLFVALLVLRTMPKPGTGYTVWMMVVMGGVMTTAVSLIWLLFCCSDTKRYTRLKAGEGIIERWTVDAARWEWFRQQSMEWDRREGVRSNLANLDQTPGPAGIEIIVAVDCLLIGGNFHALDKNVAIKSWPDWMEFHQIIHKPRGAPMHIHLRIPLAPGGQEQADRIIQVYREAYAASAAKYANPWVKIYILLGIAVVFAALIGLVALLMHLQILPQ